MTNINEIIKAIYVQLNWRGPNGKSQGIITVPRSDMFCLLQYVKSSEAYARVADAQQD